jgi:hypothetical protein
VEVPDQNLALEWIDNNRALVEEMLIMRVIEKNNQNQQRNSNQAPRLSHEEITEVNW